MNTLFAGGMGVEPATNVSQFYLGLYGGYGHINGSYKSDGNYAQGRVAFGAAFKQLSNNTVGFELGLQSGNSMRLNGNQIFNGVPAVIPLANLKPIIDGLITIKGKFQQGQDMFYMVKGGIAYRQYHLEDRTSSHDTLNEIAPELQIGLGKTITPNLAATIFYQGIYSNSSTGIGRDAFGDTTIQHIPTQQAGFIGIEYTLN
jgi:hypothetical protein